MHSAIVIAFVALVASASALPPIVIAPGALVSSDDVSIQVGTDLRGINRDVANLAGAQLSQAARAAQAAAANQAALINAENVQAIQNARQVAANRINQAAAISVQSAISSGAAANNQLAQAAQAALAPHQPGDIPVASIAGVAPVPLGVAGIPIAGIPVAAINAGGLIGIAGHGLVAGSVIV